MPHVAFYHNCEWQRLDAALACSSSCLLLEASVRLQVDEAIIIKVLQVSDGHG